MMTTVVEISDDEDANDCVITSIVRVVDDKSKCDIYNEALKENQHLADLIARCLKLENSHGMLKVLNDLLKLYYAADKAARESPNIQKKIRRANYLIKTEPRRMFSHIKDLYKILEAIESKKRVPFVTLTTNIRDVNCQPNELKRTMEHLNTPNCPSKKAKLNVNIVSPFCETVTNSHNETCETVDESITIGNASQQSSIIEEDLLLIPKKDVPVFPTGTEKRIKAIENKIAYYMKTIAKLDEQEVYDDSVNSPYIKSERLKAKIVSLYEERCRIAGNDTMKRKGIRLRSANGRPPGPTKVLERFLNKNCNKYGDPPFPDFCDVITCVTEANDKDNLGWSKAQIMNEANSLFTQCGQALQRRRQKREYRFLMGNVKSEELDVDPAEGDEQLRAKLEANKRIAIKKESDILERYTMMQHLPKSKTQKNTTVPNTEYEEIAIENCKGDAQQEVTHNINKKSNMGTSTPTVDENEESNLYVSVESTEERGMIPFKSYSDEESCRGRDDINENVNDSKPRVDVNIKENTTSNLLQNDKSTNGSPSVSTERDANQVNDSNSKAIPNKIINNSAGHIFESGIEVKNKDDVFNNNSCNDNDSVTNTLNVNKHPILRNESLESTLDEDITRFKKIGDNFTITIEIMSDN